METLQLLGVALGLAALAGINLYLTVFVTGMAIRFEWVALAPQYQSLEILADPVIIGISGAFFLMEFFADKIPWVDSVWDSVHTIIRPVGGALLAVLALGQPNPVFDVAVALLAGTVSLSTHSVKAASRLVVNASPEPFSNIALSLAEDVFVIGGMGLLVWNPLLGLGLVVLAMAGVAFFGPKILRAVRSRVFFAWRKLTSPAAEKPDPDTPARIPVDVDCLLHQRHPGEVRVLHSLLSHSAKLPGVPSNCRGHLVVLAGEPSSVYWAGKSWFRARCVAIETQGCKVDFQPGFLFDRLTIYSPTSGRRWIFAVDRASREAALRLVALLSSLCPASSPPASRLPIDSSTPHESSFSPDASAPGAPGDNPAKR